MRRRARRSSRPARPGLAAADHGSRPDDVVAAEAELVGGHPLVRRDLGSARRRKREGARQRPVEHELRARIGHPLGKRYRSGLEGGHRHAPGGVEPPAEQAGQQLARSETRRARRRCRVPSMSSRPDTTRRHPSRYRSRRPPRRARARLPALVRPARRTLLRGKPPRVTFCVLGLPSRPAGRAGAGYSGSGCSSAQKATTGNPLRPAPVPASRAPSSAGRSPCGRSARWQPRLRTSIERAVVGALHQRDRAGGADLEGLDRRSRRRRRGVDRAPLRLVRLASTTTTGSADVRDRRRPLRVQRKQAVGRILRDDLRLRRSGRGERARARNGCDHDRPVRWPHPTPFAQSCDLQDSAKTPSRVTEPKCGAYEGGSAGLARAQPKWNRDKTTGVRGEAPI